MTLPFERLFSMSAVEALRIIRRLQQLQPDVGIQELGRIAATASADASALDFEAANVLSSIVPLGPHPEESFQFYQHCVEVLIFSERPFWARVITLGRSVFVEKLTRDEAQCFREAGLLVDPITLPVMEWWDRINARVRLVGDEERMRRARQAEQLTIEHELARLRALGIDQSPVWIAVEDNRKGYDVLSYDLTPVGVQNRLIEVKSTIASPLRFYLTRNEWDQATKFGASYHFHIWDLAASPPRLHQRSMKDVEPHIPKDNEKGRWSNAEIPVGPTN